MPSQVKYAIISVVVSLIVGGIDIALQFAGIIKQDTAASSPIGFVVGVAITALFLIFIAKRNNWARWVFIVLTGLDVLLKIKFIFVTQMRSDFLGAISTAIQSVLQAIAVILLLQRSVGQWFKNMVSLSSPRTTNSKRSCAVRLFVFLLTVLLTIVFGFALTTEMGRWKAKAFYAAANNGAPFAEALEKHSGWFMLKFGERPSDAEYPRGHSDCGYAGKEQGRMVFRPYPVPADPSPREKVYLSVRDFSQAESKVFTACPWVSVLYKAVMFTSWTVSVQVDAQGKIILAKEPRFYGD